MPFKTHIIIFFPENLKKIAELLRNMSGLHKTIFCSRKKNKKKICLPTLPKIFRPVTRNTIILLFVLKS